MGCEVSSSVSSIAPRSSPCASVSTPALSQRQGRPGTGTPSPLLPCSCVVADAGANIPTVLPPPPLPLRPAPPLLCALPPLYFFPASTALLPLFRSSTPRLLHSRAGKWPLSHIISTNSLAKMGSLGADNSADEEPVGPATIATFM